MDGVVIRSNMVYFVSWGSDIFSGGEGVEVGVVVASLSELFCLILIKR